MASRFGAGRGRHRKSRQRSCRGAGDHRVASGARRLAARRFIGGRRPPGPRARRVYEVVCQGLRCSWLPHRSGEPSVSTRSLERLLGGKNGSQDPPLQEKSGYKRRAATREERLQEKSGYKRRAATREERLQEKRGYKRRAATREERLQEKSGYKRRAARLGRRALRDLGETSRKAGPTGVGETCRKGTATERSCGYERSHCRKFG